MEKSYTTIKNEIRVAAVENLYKALITVYGNDVIGKSSNSEIVVKVGIDETTGAPQYISFSPTVKDFRTYKATKKEFKAYDGIAKVQKFNDSQKKKEEDKILREQKKQEKIKRDREAREKKIAEKREKEEK